MSEKRYIWIILWIYFNLHRKQPVDTFIEKTKNSFYFQSLFGIIPDFGIRHKKMALVYKKSADYCNATIIVLLIFLVYILYFKMDLICVSDRK